MEFKNAQLINKEQENRRIMMARPSCWQKPEVGCVKLNTSSKAQDSSRSAGLGIVARGDQGEVLQVWY